MILKEAMNLILKGQFYEVIDLLEKSKNNFSEHSLTQLECLTILLISYRNARDRTPIPAINQQIQRLYSKIKLESGEILQILDIIDNMITGQEKEEDTIKKLQLLSNVNLNSIPLLLYLKYSPEIIQKDYNVNLPLFQKLWVLFETFNGKFYYAQISLNVTWSYLYKTYNSLALEYTDKSLQLYKEIHDEYGQMFINVTKGAIYGNIGNCRKAIKFSLEYLNEAEKLGNINIIWHACFAVALYYGMANDIKNASKYNTRCIELEKHPKFNDRFTVHTRKLVETRIYWGKGNIDKALKLQLQLLDYHKKSPDRYSYAITLSLLGDTYYQKGDLNRAYSYYKESLAVRSSFGALSQIAENYLQIIIISLEQDQQERAKEYQELLKKLKESVNEEALDQMYFLSEALFLRTYIDRESKKKAKRILIDLIDQDITYYQTIERAYLYLCDLILEEIKASNDLSLLNELREYVKRLAALATMNDSHRLLIELYFLQSKMFLLELKVKEAIELLVLAQKIANDKALVRLEILLSNEHDTLLKQLDVWEDFTGHLHILENRFEYTHIEILLNNMIRNWISYTNIDVEIESPCYFLISNKNGNILFSDSYSSLPFDSEKISFILKEIMIRSVENNQQKFIRFCYQEYTCLLTIKECLSLCYVFMGPSYLPHKKMQSLVQDESFVRSLSTITSKNEKNVFLSTKNRIEISEFVDAYILSNIF